MSDAEARAKEVAREFCMKATQAGADMISGVYGKKDGEGWKERCEEILDELTEDLAALLRAAGAGTWSKDLPVHEGWYWTRAHGGTAVTEVRERSTRGRLCADLNGGWYPLSAPALFGREWSGPIPVPEE